jgi:hypothetical protein
MKGVITPDYACLVEVHTNAASMSTMRGRRSSTALVAEIP